MVCCQQDIGARLFRVKAAIDADVELIWGVAPVNVVVDGQVELPIVDVELLKRKVYGE